MATPTILLMPGSIRRDGLHRRFASALSPLLAAGGAAVEPVDLTDYPMPIYHGDLEDTHGAPDSAVALTELVGGADGVVVLSPEHNGGPSALLKNSIDWVTRVDRDALRRPLVALAATSPGSRGGLAGLDVVRRIFTHMRLDLFGDDLSIPRGAEAFAFGGAAASFARPADMERARGFADAYLGAVVEQMAARMAAS